MRHVILLALAGAMLPGMVAAQPVAEAPAEQPQARIPFANHGGITGWQQGGRSTIYLEGTGRQWYRGELMGYCPGFDTATAIGFEANASGDFDSFSKLIVGGKPCPLKSLVRSGPPPKKVNKAKNAQPDG